MTPTTYPADRTALLIVDPYNDFTAAMGTLSLPLMVYRMPPHSHPTDERVEVKQGTLLIGMGDRLDAKKSRGRASSRTGTSTVAGSCRAHSAESGSNKIPARPGVSTR